MDSTSLVFEDAVALGVDGCDGEPATEGVAELLALAARDRRRLEAVMYRLALPQPGADTDRALALVRQAVWRAAASHDPARSPLGAGQVGS